MLLPFGLPRIFPGERARAAYPAGVRWVALTGGLLLTLGLGGCPAPPVEDPVEKEAPPPLSAVEHYTITAQRPLLDARTSWPAAELPGRGEEIFTLALVGVGGEEHQGLFLRTALQEGNPGEQTTVRAWVQQENLSPAELGRQERQGSWEEWSSLTENELTGRAKARIFSPEQAGQPAVEEVFALRFQLEPAETLPDLRPDRSSPPWRRLDFPMEGRPLAGSFRGSVTRTIGEETTTSQLEGPAYAAVRPALRPGGPWVSEGDGTFEMLPLLGVGVAGALSWEAALPEGLADSEPGVRERLLWPERRDLRAFNALLVEYQADPQPGAALGVWLEESPGLWSFFADALPLAGGRRTLLLPFSGFEAQGFDPDLWLTPNSLGGLGFSLPSGEGIVRASGQILRVDGVLAAGPGLLTAGPLPWSQPPPAVSVEVDFSTQRQVNGSSAVPEGLFAIHTSHTPSTPDGWEELRQAGVRGLSTLIRADFSKPYPPDRVQRGPAPLFAKHLGEPVASHLIECWTWGGLLDFPPWAPDLAAATARTGAFFRPILQASRRSVDGDPSTLRRIEIWHEPFLWARHFNRPGSPLVDPEQKGSLPGPVAAEAYLELFRAVATARAEIHPQVALGAPSSARFGADRWRHLEQFVLPIVAGAGESLDFVTEHHYGGRGRQFAAEYEVFQAAVQPLREKRLPLANTESNDLADPPAGHASGFGLHTGERRRAVYALSEILAHLRYGPDHTFFRAIQWPHPICYETSGEALALRLLSDLRGHLVPLRLSQRPNAVALEENPESAETPEDSLVPVPATEDWFYLQGVAARSGDEGLAVLLNEGPWPVEVALRVPGATLLQGKFLDWTAADGLSLSELAPLVDEEEECWHFILPPLSAAALEFGIDVPNTLVEEQTVLYGRSGERGALWELSGGQTLTLEFPGEETAPGQLRAFRFVADGLFPAQAELVFGELRVPLPPSNNAPRRILTVLLPEGTNPKNVRLECLPGAIPFRLASMALVFY